MFCWVRAGFENPLAKLAKASGYSFAKFEIDKQSSLDWSIVKIHTRDQYFQLQMYQVVLVGNWN